MWNVIFSALSVSSFILCCVALFFAVRAATAVLELRRALQDFRPWSAQSLETRLSELESSLSVVANRLKMTKVRNAATHVDRDKGGEPDARSDPEAWRTWKNAQLRAGQYNA